MTWDAYNRRKTALRTALEVADRDRTTTASDLLAAVPEAREAFDDDAHLLLDVQLAWFQRLSGTLDRLGAESDESPETVAVSAWASAAAEMPGARALLDAEADRPELRKALAKERALLAAAAGVSPQSPRLAADRGAHIIDLAREVTVLPEPVELDARRSLMDRLRSALAA